MISPWWSIALTLGDIFGHWIIGNKKRWGWVWNSFVEVLWIAYSFATGQPGFLAMSLLHLVVFGRNYVRWGEPGHDHIHRHPHSHQDGRHSQSLPNRSPGGHHHVIRAGGFRP